MLRPGSRHPDSANSLASHPRTHQTTSIRKDELVPCMMPGSGDRVLYTH